MPEQILLIAPQEIIQVEARCPDCENTATFDMLGTSARETANCPFCGAEWIPHKDAVAALREGLKAARRVGEMIKLRVRFGAPVAGLRKRE